MKIIILNIKGMKKLFANKATFRRIDLGILNATDISNSVPKSIESSLQKPPKKEGWDVETGN